MKLTRKWIITVVIKYLRLLANEFKIIGKKSNLLILTLIGNMSFKVFLCFINGMLIKSLLELKDYDS
jgi:hypothetical protein